MIISLQSYCFFLKYAKKSALLMQIFCVMFDVLCVYARGAIYVHNKKAVNRILDLPLGK